MAASKVAKLKLKNRERLSIFTDLSTMLSAGIPILEAVQSLETDNKGQPEKVLHHIRTSINNGIPLSKSMGQMPGAFNPITVNLIRAAEAGGTLEETLRDTVKATRKDIAFSDQLRNTMIYPLFVMALFLGIVILMLAFVIPRIALVFRSLNVKEPLITRVLIHVSQFFTHYWLFILAVIVLIAVLTAAFISSNKAFLIRSILSLPMFKTLGINIDLTRFTRSFGLLMSSGVPILDSLKLSENVVQKNEIKTVIQQMQKDVSAGKSITLSMRGENSVIPTIMWRSIKTAESTGTLDQTLQNLNEHFDDQVTESLKILSSLLEPILIVTVGVMVGFLMIAIIAPIYNMISQINSAAR
jgi:type II secretory pathway component PulF